MAWVDNWFEPIPGFWLPKSWNYDSSRWPDYTKPGALEEENNASVESGVGTFVVRKVAGVGAGEQIDVRDVVRLRGATQPSKRAWAAWLSAYRNGRDLKRGWDELERIADKKYQLARFEFLVPEWRRLTLKLLTELDDIEDQLSTILWVGGWIVKKWIPNADKLLRPARELNQSLDCVEKVVAGITPFRTGKSDYAQCVKRKKRMLEQQLKEKQGLLAWLRRNWGNLLEASQATGDWFDVGIRLGPIMGFIEDGWWGVAQQQWKSPSTSIGILLPGYDQFQGYAWNQAKAFIDKTVLEPMRAVDWESIEVGPFDF